MNRKYIIYKKQINNQFDMNLEKEDKHEIEDIKWAIIGNVQFPMKN